MNDPKNLHHCTSWVHGRSFGGRTVHGGDNHEITNNSKLQKIPLFCHNPQVRIDSCIYRNVQPPTRIQTCCKWRIGCWNILQQRSLLLRTKHEPSSVLEKSLAGNHKWTIIAHIKDTLFSAHDYQAAKMDLDKRSVSFSMSIGPVWPLIPFLNWLTPSVHTADKGHIYNLKWQVLAIFVPLSAWINCFHLKAKVLLLWAALRSKAVCTDFTGSLCGLN